MNILSTLLQCSLCTKTAQQLGAQPSKGLNLGIIVLMIIPIALIAFLFFIFKKKYKR